jgi:hypothetical protein
MAFKQYFMRLGGGRACGPVDEKTLRQLASMGRLTANDRVALSKDGPWHTVSIPRCGTVIDIERIGDVEFPIMGQPRALRGRRGNNWNTRRKR